MIPIKYFFPIFLFLLTSCTRQGRHADLVILGDAIYTMDERQPVVQAVAVGGDKIGNTYVF